MRITVCRKGHFSAAHRLHNPNWDDEKNQRVFGDCNNPQFHGHNYEVIVKVTGELDPETGYLIDLKILRDMINEHVLDRFDHRNLYTEVEDFRNLNPTAENIAIVIWKILREKIDKKYEIKVTLYETERNFVEYEGQ